MNSEAKLKVQTLLEELRENERQRTCGKDASQRYYKLHEYRFQKTAEICRHLVPQKDARVLDIGSSFLTHLLAHYYSSVTTMGLESEIDTGGQRNSSADTSAVPHIVFELNNARDISLWPEIPARYNLIVYAETMEHLFTAPEYSLLFLSTLLAEHGVLLVTTPNAAMIMKRLILLLKGKNPFERIRLLSENPGHYRELTMDELTAIGTRCQLSVLYKKHLNFFAPATPLQGFLKALTPSFKDTLVVAFSKHTS